MSGAHLRRKLLAGTISGTDTAFELIAEVAAIPGVKVVACARHRLARQHRRCRGAAVPRAERIRTADPETDEPFESPMSGRSLRWINDGQPGALCPVAIRAWHASNVDDMMDLECRGGGAAELCSPVANGAAAWVTRTCP